MNQPYFCSSLAPPTNYSTRMRIQGKIRLVYETNRRNGFDCEYLLIAKCEFF